MLNVNYSAPSVRQYKRSLSLRDRLRITLETIQPYCFESNYSQKVPICLEQFPLTETGCLPIPVDDENIPRLIFDLDTRLAVKKSKLSLTAEENQVRLVYENSVSEK